MKNAFITLKDILLDCSLILIIACIPLATIALSNGI